MRKEFTKTPAEIEIIAEGGAIMNDILHRTAKLAVPGTSTYALNEFAANEIIKAGGRPSFLGYGPDRNPFPAALCTSVNNVVVHGIPSTKAILKVGDIIGLDIGMEYKGLYTDTAITVPVGTVNKKIGLLVATTKRALANAIAQAKVGNRIGDISHAIQTTVEKEGFAVVRELVGHGVGYEVHEDPMVPCYGKAGTGLELVEGMVLAIEPMVCEKSPRIYMGKDGWAILTDDGGHAAHFEHTIAITKKGPRILT